MANTSAVRVVFLEKTVSKGGEKMEGNACQGRGGESGHTVPSPMFFGKDQDLLISFWFLEKRTCQEGKKFELKNSSPA